ncbi:uncharacterized protein LOC112568157 isoform X2 [Pomacea canaliculata]|uniref:uncharacterized protein LOC112568157 isoform X2 n=1 Tax=Pomacea canaliculata TaxID=400727 RepID=UPI000D7386D5|nr:uncharacterized protein LOC112568157 isoform X2 [Pomacea canaliculata]
MYFCDLHENKPGMWIVWTAHVLVFFGVTGVNISPCDDNGVREVLADQDTVFTCTAEGHVEWKFEYNDSNKTVSLANCESTCKELNNYKNLFKASIVKARHSSSMTITTVKHRNIVHLLNGSLLCVLMAGSAQVASVRCGLHYVYPPEDVSCTAVNTSWAVIVSCSVRRVYSSRGLYTCQLYRLEQSQNKSLETVAMLTSPTREYIGEKEVKVSGFCQFNTTLPTEEGQYAFRVSVSPGGRTYYANFTDKYNWITTERPCLPRVSCGPQQYVLENTNATCTCKTSSLGQPAGYLIWIIGDQTDLETTSTEGQQNLASHELHHTHFFTQADHGRTWFRCDVVWGLEKIHGENYTVNVGYAARQAQFVLNGNKENQTVNERNLVNFLCESNGQPTPNISIYNNDNDTVLFKDTSPVNYTFIARCEDTATYTCSSQNEFSHQSGVTTSVSLDLNVRCKPRVHSSKRLGFYMMNHQTEMNFDIIAYPVPHEYHVWFVKSPINNSEDAHNEGKDTMVNITCQSSVFRRYLSTCSLRVVNINSLSTGSYKVQVINEAGDENFTVTIDFNVPSDLETHYTAVTSGVVCVIVFIFTIVVVIVIIRKRKERKAPLRIHTVEAEATPGPTQPEPCQTPLYAVVDKTKKKRNPHPALNADTEEQMEKESKQGIEVPEPSLPPTCQVLYAVVDKTRNKSPVRRKEGYSTEDSKRKSDDLGDYQNIMDPHSAQDEDYVQLDVRSPASRSHTVDDGRWLNSAGLLYTFPTFDVGNGVRCRPPPTHEETEYCALRLMADAFPAIGRKSND